MTGGRVQDAGLPWRGDGGGIQTASGQKITLYDGAARERIIHAVNNEPELVAEVAALQGRLEALREFLEGDADVVAVDGAWRAGWTAARTGALAVLAGEPVPAGLAGLLAGAGARDVSGDEVAYWGTDWREGEAIGEGTVASSWTAMRDPSPRGDVVDVDGVRGVDVTAVPVEDRS